MQPPAVAMLVLASVIAISPSSSVPMKEQGSDGGSDHRNVHEFPAEECTACHNIDVSTLPNGLFQNVLKYLAESIDGPTDGVTRTLRNGNIKKDVIERDGTNVLTFTKNDCIETQVLVVPDEDDIEVNDIIFGGPGIYKSTIDPDLEANVFSTIQTISEVPGEGTFHEFRATVPATLIIHNQDDILNDNQSTDEKWGIAPTVTEFEISASTPSLIILKDPFEENVNPERRENRQSPIKTDGDESSSEEDSEEPYTPGTPCLIIIDQSEEDPEDIPDSTVPESPANTPKTNDQSLVKIGQTATVTPDISPAFAQNQDPSSDEPKPTNPSLVKIGQTATVSPDISPAFAQNQETSSVKPKAINPSLVKIGQTETMSPDISPAFAENQEPSSDESTPTLLILEDTEDTDDVDSSEALGQPSDEPKPFLVILEDPEDTDDEASPEDLGQPSDEPKPFLVILEDPEDTDDEASPEDLGQPSDEPNPTLAVINDSESDSSEEPGAPISNTPPSSDRPAPEKYTPTLVILEDNRNCDNPEDCESEESEESEEVDEAEDNPLANTILDNKSPASPSIAKDEKNRY